MKAINVFYYGLAVVWLGFAVWGLVSIVYWGIVVPALNIFGVLLFGGCGVGALFAARHYWKKGSRKYDDSEDGSGEMILARP